MICHDAMMMQPLGDWRDTLHQQAALVRNPKPTFFWLPDITFSLLEYYNLDSSEPRKENSKNGISATRLATWAMATKQQTAKIP